MVHGVVNNTLGSRGRRRRGLSVRLPLLLRLLVPLLLLMLVYRRWGRWWRRRRWLLIWGLLLLIWLLRGILLILLVLVRLRTVPACSFVRILILPSETRRPAPAQLPTPPLAEAETYYCSSAPPWPSLAESRLPTHPSPLEARRRAVSPRSVAAARTCFAAVAGGKRGSERVLATAVGLYERILLNA